MQVKDLNQSLERQRKELNDCRAEITALKMHIEGSRSGWNLAANDVDHAQAESLERYKEEIKSLQMEIEGLRAKQTGVPDSVNSMNSEKEAIHVDEEVVEIHEDKNVISQLADPPLRVADTEDAPLATEPSDASMIKLEEPSHGSLMSSNDNRKQLLMSSNDTSFLDNSESISKHHGDLLSEDAGLLLKEDNRSVEALPEKMVSSFYFIQVIRALNTWLN